MRLRIANSAMLVCLALGLAGCSTTRGTSAKSSWWPPISLKSKKSADSQALSRNAPQAPAFATTAQVQPPSVSMPGAAPNYGGTQYPVTPYPPTAAPAYTAAAPQGASGGYMPATNPYAAPAGSNPYAAPAAAADPYAQANPYAQTGAYSPAPNQDAAYTAGAQPYGASSYPPAPAGGAESPYSYTR